MRQKDLGRPHTPAEYVRIYLTGFAMGAADIVPGVSGGTIAFIGGIYTTLLNAIKSFDVKALRLGIGLQFRALFEHIPVRFLVTLLLGIGTAIFLLANALGQALEEAPTFVFAFFGGLIVASIVAILPRMRWDVLHVIVFVVAAVFAFFLVGLNPLEDADHSLPVLFLSGMVAICAMILPGISGSFILLILGQYQFILGAVRSFDLLSVAAVGVGAVVGILGFTRALSWLLKHYESITIAALVGFMLGSLRKIWDESVAGLELLTSFGIAEAALLVGLIVLGFLLVSVLDHIQSGENALLRHVWKTRGLDTV